MAVVLSALLQVAPIATARAEPAIRVQWVPAIDLVGPLAGVEAWGLTPLGVAYAGAGWEFRDPLDPQGDQRDGLRGRAGFTLLMNGADTLDLRMALWPGSWVPGWDGFAGMQVVWQHLPATGVRGSAGALLGDVWTRRALVRGWLWPVEGVARVRALRLAASTRLEIAPQLWTEPYVEMVGGVSPSAGNPKDTYGFGSVRARLPVNAGDFKLEVSFGYAGGGPGGLVPVGLEGRRLGFRAGGWPAEMLARGARPAADADPQPFGLSFSFERDFDLPPLPPRLAFWPESAPYLFLFADAAWAGTDFKSGLGQSAATFGLGAGVRSRSGRLESYVGVEPQASGSPAVRLSARWVPTL